MLKHDALSYVWSDEFVSKALFLNEGILNETIDCKYKNIRLAFFRQMVSLRNALDGDGVCFKEGLAEDFNFQFGSVYEQTLLQWVAAINHVDEITKNKNIDYDNDVQFNANKFYNFLDQKPIEIVITNLADNLALYTELIYAKYFFEIATKKISYMIKLLYKKICVYGMIWVRKGVFHATTPLSKKLSEIIIHAKLYSMILSLAVTTTRKMFGFFQLLSKKEVETRYEKLIILSPSYKSLHDFMYKNLLVSMFDYQNATKNMRIMSVKNVTCNFTLNEIEESMFDENASVFKDMTVYEKLADISTSTSDLLNEEEIYSDASNWFKDLTMNQKRDLLPYLHVSRGGLDTKLIIRMENSFVVNGGVKSDSNDEWSTWRRYVTKLFVNYVENLEDNEGEVEVIMF